MNVCERGQLTSFFMSFILQLNYGGISMKDLFYMNIKNNDCDFDRIDRMRERMHNRKAYICSQRALLYTESFKKSENEAYIIRKAKAFAHTLRNMDIYIEEDSLIFGNMGYRNFSAPIYPEFSIDWVIKELDEFAATVPNVKFFLGGAGAMDAAEHITLKKIEFVHTLDFLNDLQP